MQKKNWRFRSSPCNNTESAVLAGELGCSNCLAELLICRGIDSLQAYRKFIDEAEGCADPYFLPDMEKGVRRIRKALDDGEKILIYGDYDADGVTSVALLYLYLKKCGGNVEFYIPDRFKDGYGMNCRVIDEIAENGVSLIITVDTGISSENEICHAKSLGMDTVVTDHHECLLGVPPSAFAVINPKRDDCIAEFREYSGVGVAFMTVMALEGLNMPIDEARENIYRGYSDIAAIGTVADVMPIKGENRSIVKRGLEKVNKGECNKGIAALLSSAKGKLGKVNTTTLGFVLGPRINAAGRLAHAAEAEELFLEEDYHRCLEIGDKLCRYNARRQQIEAEIFEQACFIIEKEGKSEKKVIVCHSSDWNHGVVGIVCSKLVERYHRPVILFCHEGENAKGSGRGIEGFNLADAINSCSQHVVKYGGHELAAGLTVALDKLDDFENAINLYASCHMPEEYLGAGYIIDLQLSPNQLTLPFANEISVLEPFGQDNPEPVFLLKGAVITEMRLLSGGKHTKFTLSADKLSFEAMMFGKNGEDEGLFVNDTIDIVFGFEINEYMGRKKLTLNIKDYCLSGKTVTAFENLYEMWQSFDLLDINEKRACLPSRSECVPVYKKLIMHGDGAKLISIKEFLPSNPGKKQYFKLRLIFEMFKQGGLANVEFEDFCRLRVRIFDRTDKVDLTKTPVYTDIM